MIRLNCGGRSGSPGSPSKPEIIYCADGNKRFARIAASFGYTYGSTPVPAWEFGDRPVHLLGGSPQEQRKLYHYLNVVSLDGNMMLLMANGAPKTGVVSVWQPNSRKYEKGYWVRLDTYRRVEHNLPPVDYDAPYEAFKISCKNIMAMWRAL